MPQSDVIMNRLEDQIRWYDLKSGYNQRMFKRLKTVKIVIAAFIPLTTYVGPYKIVPAALGAVIAITESLHQLNQYDRNWTTYRSTAEALEHEKYLFLSGAGPYAASNPKALLAERTESLVSEGNAKYSSVQE